MPYVYVGKLSLLKTLSWLKNITLYPNSLLAAFGVFGLFIVTKKKNKKNTEYYENTLLSNHLLWRKSQHLKHK